MRWSGEGGGGVGTDQWIGLGEARLMLYLLKLGNRTDLGNAMFD